MYPFASRVSVEFGSSIIGLTLVSVVVFFVPAGICVVGDPSIIAPVILSTMAAFVVLDVDWVWASVLVI